MSQENVEIVRELVEAVQRGDFTEAVTHLAPDVAYIVSQEGPAHGPDAARTTHEWGRGRETGIEVDGRFFNIFTLRNGKVVHKVEFTERAEALAAAGLRE